MNTIFLYILIIVLCWTFNPFLKKTVMKKMTAGEYFVINHFVITIFVLFYFFYLFNNGKCDIKCLMNLDKKEVTYLILASLTTILATIILLYLINLKDVSYIIAHVQPVVIALTVVVGYMFFSEHITRLKIFGISLVILGLIIMNMS
jgi:uncharacterized membrane protein